MKKSVLIFLMSIGIAMSGVAGDVSVTETEITYEMGVGVSDGTEFLCRFDFGSNVLTTDFADGDLTVTSSTSNGESVTIRSGGTIGDTFAEYRIILSNTGDLTTGDKLVLDLSTFGLDSTSYTVTVTVSDDFGIFDTSGNHTASAAVPTTPEPTPVPPAPEPEPTPVPPIEEPPTGDETEPTPVPPIEEPPTGDETVPTPVPTPEPTPTPEETPEETPLRVPTLSQWGFVLTSLIVLCLGIFSIRKKHNSI